MTNRYCEILDIEVPRLAAVKEHRNANTFALLIVALLERGGAMTLAEVAERFSQAGIAPAERALLSLRRCKPARPPVHRDGERYELDPHDSDLDLWLFRLGLRPPKVACVSVVRPPPPARSPPDQPLDVAELEEAWKDASLHSWSASRLTLAVLDAHGGLMPPQDVVAFVSGCTRSHGLAPHSERFIRHGSPVTVQADGCWAVAPGAEQLHAARAAVRNRLDDVRRWASGRPDPSVLEAYDRAEERRRTTYADELARMRRVLVHAFPPKTPAAVVLLDMGRRELRTFIGDELEHATERLAEYESIAGVGVRATLRALGFDPDRRRLTELGPPQKTMKLNRRGRLLKITSEMLIAGSCGISRPLGDPKTLRKYLHEGKHTQLRRRLEADAKSLFALHEYGRLHRSVRLRWGFLEERLPAPWAHRDETTLYHLKRRAHELGCGLEIVAGHAPAWSSPWSRAIRCDVCEEPGAYFSSLHLIDEDGRYVADDDVQLARLGAERR